MALAFVINVLGNKIIGTTATTTAIIKVLGIALLATFIYLKYLDDSFVLIVALVGITLIIIAERLFMISHTESQGKMHMGMDDEVMKAKM